MKSVKIRYILKYIYKMIETPVNGFLGVILLKEFREEGFEYIVWIMWNRSYEWAIGNEARKG